MQRCSLVRMLLFQLLWPLGLQDQNIHILKYLYFKTIVSFLKVKLYIIVNCTVTLQQYTL